MSKTGKKSSEPKTVELDYVKSTAHRVVFVSGAHGGLTPDGVHIHMSLFNERSAIPQADIHDLEAGGTLGRLLERRMRSDIVREVEITLILDMAGAKMLKGWAENAIELLEQATKKRQEQDGGKK